MAGFLTHQLDYIFFFYGLSFFMMALSCLSMRRPEGESMPWWLLGLFGVTHGLNEWLDLAAYSIGDSPPFSAVRAAILMASFLFLAEFGRSGLKRAGVWMPGRWALVLLAGLAGAGGLLFGTVGLNAAARYSLGLVGGLAAAFALARASGGRPAPEGRWLAVSGFVIGAYALATGLVVPDAPFFPASVINQDAFLEAAGMPVQLVRGVLAVAAAFAISSYGVALSRRESGSTGPLFSNRPLLVVLVIVAAGWFVTEGIGDRDKEEFNQLHQQMAATLASAVEIEHVPELAEMKGPPDPTRYGHLENLIGLLHRSNPDILSMQLRTVKDGMFVLISDDIPVDSPAHHEYGHVFGPATGKELSDYTSGASSMQDLFEEYELTAVRAVVPVKSPDGVMLAQLIVDFDAEAAERLARWDRLLAVLITCVLSLLTFAVFTAWYRTKESLGQAAELRLASVVAKSEKRLGAITSALGEGVIQMDTNGAVSFMNPEAERLVGWREEELAGRDAHDLLHHHSADGSVARREDCPSLKVIETGETRQTEEELFTRKDGTTFPVSYVTAPIVMDGRVAGAVVAFRDITERKRAEQELRESERSYRTLSENLPGMVYRITLGDKPVMQFFNKAVHPMTGYRADELKVDKLCSFESHIVEEDLSRVLNAVNLSMMEGVPFEVEYRFRHKDGGTRYFIERGRTVMDEDGKPSHIDGVILDITERKRAESELSKFRFIVEGSGEEFYLIDRSGHIEYANEAASRSLGYTQDEIRGMEISRIDPSLNEGAFREHFEVLGHGNMPPFETTHLTRHGRRVPKEVRAERIVVEGRECVCAIVRDITEKKELERQRSDFFSIVTHDLKSPLSVIAAYADIILDEYADRIPSEVRDACVSIRSSSDKVIALVEDYLALSRLESGMVERSMSKVDPGEIVADAGLTARALSTGRALEIKVEAEADVPEVRGDRGYLVRAVTNLVQNAVNYTEDGGSITIGCRVKKLEGSEFAEIWVSDTGCGISHDEREKIFDRYYRSARTSRKKGSGLGLTIVAAIARAHGGRVLLESEEGRGSTFSILVPV